MRELYTIEKTDGRGDPGDLWEFVDRVTSYSPAGAAREAAIKHSLEGVLLRVTGEYSRPELIRFISLKK